MDPKEVLSAALKEAMKNKDAARRDTLRLLQSAIKQVEIDTQKTLSNEEVINILQKEAKKRRESIEELEGAGRDSSSEKDELKVIEEFLPRQLSYDELKVIAQAMIAELGVTSGKEINKVMSPLLARVKGQADGKLVNQVVRDLLNG
ncbi:MAG: GatB/YqeY domain-containing protein [Anaerolineae bacterium]|jgi:hypothetical protein|nr:GatB/YqeY domain-containing protein [Anaerolineae bacterium]